VLTNTRTATRKQQAQASDSSKQQLTITTPQQLLSKSKQQVATACTDMHLLARKHAGIHARTRACKQAGI